MGAGGRMKDGNSNDDVCKRVPIEKPPFEFSDLKKAIPPHCFKRDLLRSSYYLFRDLIIIFGLYYFAEYYIPLLPKPLAYIAWPMYWFCQGTMFMGLWTLAHDLGHHSFSDYQWLDDTIGFLIHSSFLTPYFSFKYSHRRHHAHAGSIEYDEVFIPKRKADWLYSEFLNNPIGNLFFTLVKELIGLPLYLLVNVHGRKYDRLFASHFNPLGPIFNDSERGQIWLSIGGVFVVAYTLYQAALTNGTNWLICIYGMPYLVFNIHFMMVTFLNHTHPALPHYDSKSWDWMRSALATVDRDYGILNDIFKSVTNAHVIHHFVTTMPHYHMVEATNAIKPILGEYYKYDDTPILKAFWRESKECIYAEPDEGAEDSGVYWYRR
uniref:omega-6 fatty acid desaturase, endoplasmic reticulum-like n=1 Tax=Erigeron canadensis TaxID=72917 RepID=UPI001CB96B21|nr:omega-6 fatty acid desaturase, endoplasmic reticulum-like [Erigeron canadensis]